jgi:hypothetical protein
MNKIRIIAFIIGLVLIPNFLLCNTTIKDSSIAVLNGEQISLKLWLHFIQKNRASVINEFTQKYKITDYSNLWYSSFGNKEVPAEILKNNSLQDCYRTTAQLILAKKKGILKDISYEGFLKKLKESNKFRKQAALEKKTIYGPVEFTEATYYDYLFSLTVLELKKKLTGKELDTNQKKMNAFYENNKLKKYCKKGSLDFYSFENVKTNVRSDFIDYQYDNLINGQIKNAKIKINNELYKKIRIE